ncbi:hypothetical protein AC578_4642 [Pseudocercospora eumusae]|uniref:Uncharacterized protein n=1 Tax=Pseudocercospora eumusae TaxID=321146 RepID=A0A139H7I8_9PEZI|nr:hypothetical protein AC578_4642 [Pseudocercospora eumusae]KXS98382.1 hypothetical protein AC578_4642 [Pseudocercospora eumusae]
MALSAFYRTLTAKSILQCSISGSLKRRTQTKRCSHGTSAASMIERPHVTLSAASTLDLPTLIPAGQNLHQRNHVAFHVLLRPFPSIFLTNRGPLQTKSRIKLYADCAVSWSVAGKTRADVAELTEIRLGENGTAVLYRAFQVDLQRKSCQCLDMASNSPGLQASSRHGGILAHGMSP